MKPPKTVIVVLLLLTLFLAEFNGMTWLHGNGEDISAMMIVRVRYPERAIGITGDGTICLTGFDHGVYFTRIYHPVPIGK